MNMTQEQRDAIASDIQSWEYEVWMTRNAAKSDNQWSEYHPKHLRQRIAECRALLKASGCA